MKIMFISDIHGITTNLEKIKDIYDNGNFDKLVVLGDLYYGGFNTFDMNGFNNKVVKEFLSNYKDKMICMKGNCDSELDITISDFPINRDLSLINVDGNDIYLTHGDRYNKNNFSMRGVLMYGHYHVPSINKIGDMVYVCVGSVSLPRDGNSASYGVYEDKTITLYTIDGEVIDSVSL